MPVSVGRGASVGSTLGVGSGADGFACAYATWLPIAATTIRAPTMLAIVLSRTRRRICPSCQALRAVWRRARSASARDSALFDPRPAIVCSLDGRDVHRRLRAYRRWARRILPAVSVRRVSLDG